MTVNQTINGSCIVLEKLIEHGVDTIFGYPGGAVIPLYHEWVKYEQSLKHYRMTHEQHAVHAADGYARATGKTGVCFVTSGPGATNTVTGIATAFMDSIPLVVISGQVPSYLIGKDAFQEVDITGITVGITKHNFLVKAVEQLPEIMDKAFEIAGSGRPGPVLIDIPKDILLSAMNRQDLRVKPAIKEVVLTHLDPLKQVANMLNQAKRPLIYAGGGVKTSCAEDQLMALALKLDCPVMTSFMGNGCFDRRHPLAFGMIGMHGSKAANEAVAHADLILALGVRFSDRVVGNPRDFSVSGSIVHIDLDPTEHQKNFNVSLSVKHDIKAALETMLPYIEDHQHSEWVESIVTRLKKHPQSQAVKWIFDEINHQNDEQTIYCTDVGQHQMWSAQLIQVPKSRQWISSGGLGTMGFGLGAAIGAKLARPSESVMLITGDGSFRMNLAEMATLMDYQVKVDIVLFDNQALGMVRQWQSLFQDHVYSETTIKEGIDYSALAHAFGFKVHYCFDRLGLSEALKQAKEDTKSTLTIVKLHNDEQVFPIVPPGKNFNEMILK